MDGFDLFINDDELYPFETWQDLQVSGCLEEPPLTEEAPDIDVIVVSADPVSAAGA